MVLHSRKSSPLRRQASSNVEGRGVLILFGGLLLVLSSILEFVLGNTFSSVVFGHLGKTPTLRDMDPVD